MYKKYKDEFGPLIVYVTDGKNFPYFSMANKFLDIYRGDKRGDFPYLEEYVNHITKMLNYFEEEKELFFETDYENLKFEDFQAFLNHYYLTANKNGDLPGNMARLRMRRSISQFIYGLKKLNTDLNNHWIVEPINDRKRLCYRYELTCQKNRNGVSNPVFRMCKPFFVEKCLELAQIYDMNLYICIALSSFAGLRPGEVTNVRLKSSCYGPGYFFTYAKDGVTIMSMSIDINKTPAIRPVRSDNVFTGGIKKPRIVEVPELFIDRLTEAISLYECYTKDYMREATEPLVVNKNTKNGYHMAITYKEYIARFHKFTETYVIPEFIKEGGIKAAYADTLRDSHFGPHFFRDFFSCALVRYGYTWQQLMVARGDKSPESAICYVTSDKLEDEFDEVGSELAELINSRGDIKEKNEELNNIPAVSEYEELDELDKLYEFEEELQTEIEGINRNEEDQNWPFST